MIARDRNECTKRYPLNYYYYFRQTKSIASRRCPLTKLKQKKMNFFYVVILGFYQLHGKPRGNQKQCDRPVTPSATDTKCAIGMFLWSIFFCFFYHQKARH